MTTYRFLGPYQPEDTLAWKDGNPITCTTFLSHVAACVKILPERSFVLNMCTDRYWFLVGFAAALLRKQITLLPPSQTFHVLERIHQSYPDSFVVTDSREAVPILDPVVLGHHLGDREPPVPHLSFPGDQTGVIAFTSGSTGQPKPNMKSWASLIAIAQKTGARLSGKKPDNLTVVATVPHQHMYGLETSIMLPIQYGWSVHSARPFFPEDIRSILANLPTKRILVSTPIHLRACVTERTVFPPMESILSATAPLSQSLAKEVEGQFQTKITEIYGFAEAGTIATRQSADDDNWELLNGLSLKAQLEGFSVFAPYFPHPVPIPDAISEKGPHKFILRGRPSDLINIAGHRTSLNDLNYQLTSIQGVKDGVFVVPEEMNEQETVTRLMALAVAPEKTVEQILSQLKLQIAPVFMPRPLFLVDSLPRNPTGKLPKEAIQALIAQSGQKKSEDKSFEIEKGII